MLTIWKYPLNLPALHDAGKVTVDDNGCSLIVLAVPKRARVLSLQTIRYLNVRNSVTSLWALVDPEQPKVERAFVVVPTGGSFGRHEEHVTGTDALIAPNDARFNDLRFVDTFQVWNEREPPNPMSTVEDLGVHALMPNPLVFHLWVYLEGSAGEVEALKERRA